jgi:regulator of CtrA degradation
MTVVKTEDGIQGKNSGAATFVQSEMFGRTFSEGMSLVEETANYLDGEGRTASKNLSRDAALSYAGASMRLTTQLMQIASWLLVLRAVREGEMALAEAAEPKYRLDSSDEPEANLAGEGLPESLIGLVEETRQLYGRIRRIDAGLFPTMENKTTGADAAAQQAALLKAFGGAT